jgi:putative addiction module killer protein/probable addiction module antidote protein
VEGFPYTIAYYLTEAGGKPFKEWLDGLKDIAARQKVRIRLDRVRLGNLGKNRSVGEGVYELKIVYGPGYRVYYGLDKKTVVLLLLGGDKSSQKRTSLRPERIGRTIKGERAMVKKTTTYQEDLIEALKDPREAAAYLNAAMEEGDRELFLLALRNVAEAHGGMAAVSEKAKLNRESMYRMLSKKGNPEIKSILTLLHSMGLKMSIEPKVKVSRSARIRKAA